MSKLKWPIVLGQSFASKAIVDKIEIPEKYYRSIDNKLNKLENWASILQNVDSEKPHTWVSAGLTAARHLSTPMDTDKDISQNNPIQGFIDAKGLEVYNDSGPKYPFYKSISNKVTSQSDTALETENGIMLEYRVKGASQNFYFFLPKAQNGGEKDVSFYVPQDQKESEELNRLLIRTFWEDKEIIKVGYTQEREVEFQKIEFDGREYEGVLKEMYNKLETYVENNTRRCILFQGPPGTGKSTLAYNIAEEVSKRTVVFSQDLIQLIGQGEWESLLGLLQPEMILVDDIDRCSGELQSKLHLFEDKHCNVPVVVFTANHYERLPSAFKRPGRIDQIIEMLDPPKEIRYDVIKSLGEQEGVEIPEERMPLLDLIYQEYPGAYIVELIRRCDVEGWDYQIPEYGLTFEKLPQDIIKAWNEGKDVEDLELSSKSSSWSNKFASRQESKRNSPFSQDVKSVGKYLDELGDPSEGE